MTANTNPLDYNGYIQQIGTMAVVQTQEVGAVYQFVDEPTQAIVPQMLNYAELRIQRDLDLLLSQVSNTYTLTVANPKFALPDDDFMTVQTVEILQESTTSVVNATPLLPVSKEFIQNCYSSLVGAGPPQYYAMYGGNQNAGDTSLVNYLLLGPPPNYAYTIRVTGTQRTPSLYLNANTESASGKYTYISTYLPDLLIMASMIYISAFQRNFSATSDSPDMGQSYEKQYQALRLGAVAEEDRKKLMGSAWSSYSTPVSATPTR